MACNHKFIEHLDLKQLDFEPTTLIVGTFNPAWPDTNYAEWFYGRYSNNYFWDILPKIYKSEGLREKSPIEWQAFCKANQIALTDLISSIEDADQTNPNHTKTLGTYSDSSLMSAFKQLKPNDIITVLKENPSISNIYLTTTTQDSKWKNLWTPIIDYCEQTQKHCRQLMTPSKGARFLMTKGSGIKMFDFIYQDWESKWKF